VNIPAPQFAEMEVEIEGITPLITRPFLGKAREEMGAKQRGEVVVRGKKNPKAEYLESFYTRKGKRIAGIPGAGIKKACVTACSQVDGITKVVARGAFHILADIVEVKAGKPEMREDPVRLPKTGVADLRYRPAFFPWSAKIRVMYNENVITPAQICHLMNTAGFAVGVCEWRPEKGGTMGMFKVKGVPKKRR